MNACWLRVAACIAMTRDLPARRSTLVLAFE
jgi:hypothetical protein